MEKVVDMHSVKKELNENIEKLFRGNDKDLYYLYKINRLVTAYIENKNAALTDQSISCTN